MNDWETCVYKRIYIYIYNAVNLEESNLWLDGTKNKNSFLDNNLLVNFVPENDRAMRLFQHKKNDAINLKRT